MAKGAELYLALVTAKVLNFPFGPLPGAVEPPLGEASDVGSIV